MLPQEDTNGNQQNGLEYVVLISVQIINYKNNKLLAGSVPKRGIEVTHKAIPHQGDKLLAGSVPNPKRGIEVTHKASPLQGEEIQVQGVQLKDIENRKKMYMPNVFF